MCPNKYLHKGAYRSFIYNGRRLEVTAVPLVGEWKNGETSRQWNNIQLCKETSHQTASAHLKEIQVQSIKSKNLS